ncbi:MAG: MFS transporter [Chloroflexi bacterium]|nr:MFS transporter [Chloroflexota bacterium]
MTLPNRRSYIVFGIVSAAFLITSINGTIVAVALPRMLDDLNTSLAWVGWTLTGFMLAQGIAMALAGKISDEWGARRVLFVSMVGFAVGTFMAGFAPNVYVLIFARILQAVASGAQLPSATSIVSDSFGERRATAIGLFSSIYPVGGVVGPTIGGFVIDHFSWRWLFYGCVPISVAIFLAALALIPQTKLLSQRKRVDAIGGGLFTGSMVAILLAMTAWANDAQSIRHPLVLMLIVVGMVAMVVFLWHEGRTPSPVIELELLTSRPLAASNIYNFLFGLVLFGFSSFVPYYATVAYGMSAAESGSILAPRSVAMATASALSSIFVIRWGFRLPMVLGLVLNAPSLFLVSQGFHDVSLLGLQVPNFVLLSLIVLLAGAGQGIAAPASNNACLDLMPGKVAAMVGLRGMFRSTGGVFGTAIVILVASQFEQQQQAMGVQGVFFAFGLVSILAVPVVFLIPDTARQRHVAAREERRRAVKPVPD